MPASQIQSKAAELIVADALALARLAFEKRFASLENSVRDGVISGIDSSCDVTKYEEDLVECPACERRALTQGSYEVECEADWDVEGGEGYVLLGSDPLKVAEGVRDNW